ncbi:putative nuclease HARBI1, partial [Coccinella septempunctata]|uniref:putative nuclease HARBI1 n=1 Tax=Coccinella septempunctata TaxID=41139 RepID=UPI001D082C92
PTNRSDAAIIWNGFREKGPIPKVVGAIDGCHINITKPSEDGNSFINRHHNFSIQLQAVCDHECKFTHVYIGNCGSVHDQRVLRWSEISEYFNNPETYFPEDCHLVGDSAYTLHKYLMVPYRNNGHFTEQQIHFNRSLSSARVTIERAFGLLKNRFRRILNCCPLKETQFIPQYILACCVLHNICLMNNDLIKVESIDTGNVSADTLNRRSNEYLLAGGQDKRNKVTIDIWPGEA